MRFRSLNLIRYGKFTDFPIDLQKPDGDNEPDFHLIVGANEAGKSTTRHAITDLLFGIETRTGFDFIHDKKDLRLGAVLENDTAKIEYHRLKRRNQTLCKADDTPLPEDALAAYTGNANRTSFEREFCLDHKRLETGSRRILDSKDDVGRMLFEASAGVGIFGDFLDRLEAEADSLWAKNKSKSRKYYQAQDAFNEAKKILREATARTTEWKATNLKVVEASEALAAATKAYQTLEKTRNHLDRIRRVAPHLQTLKTTAEKLKDLGDVITLSEIAAEDLNTAKSDIANADPQTLKYQALINEAIKNRDSVSVDETLLARKEDIYELREEKSRIKNHPSGIIKQEAKSQALSKDIEGLVRDLEWAITDHESLDNALPSAILRESIKFLGNSFSGFNEAARNATENVKAKEHTLGALENELEGLPDAQLPSGIASSLNTARELGNTETSKAEINQRIHRVGDTFDTQVAKLRPWTGSSEKLRKLAVPSEAEVQEFKDNERNLITTLKAATERREKIISKINDADLKEEQLRKDANPITHEDIETSRQKRDHLWDDIKSGTKPVKEIGDKYEAHITAADDLADDRYQKAEEAKELELLRNTIAKLRLDHDEVDGTVAKIEGRQSELLTNWQLVMDKLSLGDMGISAFQTWLGRYRGALNEAEKLADEQAQLQDLETRMAMAAANLRQVFAQVDGSEEPTSPLTLQQLIDRAKADVSTDEVSRNRREQLCRNIHQETQAIEDLKEKESVAQQDLEGWKVSWSEKTNACLLPDATTPETALTALSLMSDLKEKLDRNRDIKQTRIMTMQRDMENFKKNAESLAQAVASDLMGKPADEMCTELCQQLGDAEQAQDIKTRAIREIEENTNDLDKVAALKTEAEARLAPHMNQAKVTAIDDLEAAIGRSQLFCQLTDEMEKLTKTIIDTGDGISVEKLEAEVTAEDLSTITARLIEVKEENKAALSLRDACILQVKEAETERDKIHGQADAASAEAQRQEALARMADVTQRFIKVHMGAQLLRWSIERYRDEKRGPLLERASKIFSILTLGSFKTLEIDFEGDTSQLMGRRPDGKYVDFDGLSNGTGDQLFLSLRLAAVEMQLQHAQPLPFIADDLFVNYSDDRAAKGFEALGTLATKSQVIYFTHHDHLVNVARKAISEELNVISL